MPQIALVSSHIQDRGALYKDFTKEQKPLNTCRMKTFLNKDGKS